jgi:molybdopterin-dependent oxidoreductase alpha subunit
MNERTGNTDSTSSNDLTVSQPPRTAAGVKAIKETMSHAFGKMGVVRGTRTLLSLNQKGGIDCQSCAWPDPDEHRTMAEFCESGAKALADEGTKRRVTREFFANYSVRELYDQSDFWLNEQGRLTEPMVLRSGATHYEPISWEDAFSLIADVLNSLRSPDEAIFYTSGRTSNEAAFLYQLFARQFGTNNLPDCSNMCHESSGVALNDSIGIGKSTIRLEDFTQTDLVIVIGQNPGSNAPRMMTSLQDAKRAGAKMIAINPLAEAGLMNFVNPNPQHYRNPLAYPIDLLGNRPTHLADLHLPIRIGGDMAVLKGIMKVVLERERQALCTVLDHEFIESKTGGFDELAKCLDETSWEDILSESGLTRAQIDEAAEMFIAADRVITCWAMGVTQHRKSVATIQDIVNLHLLRGQIGKPGAGVCPVRGHSNVQGDRTMGIWEKVNHKFFDALEKEFNIRAPRYDGFNTVESIRALHDGRAKVFVSMGGNFAVATPDNDFVESGIRNCRLTVQVQTKLNRSALVTGEQALLLPCLGRSEVDIQSGREQFVSTESTMLNVQMSRGVLKPASEHLRSEPWIIAHMASSVLNGKSSVAWHAMAADYDKIRDAISRTVAGCENYNERVRNKGGFYLPNKPHNGDFPTNEGVAAFRSSKLETIELPKGRLLMTTIRAHSQFNTTVYSHRDRYRGIEGSRRVIFLNPENMRDLGLETGQIVNITSYFDDRERHANCFIAVPYRIPKDCAATYFPEANPLIPVNSFAEKSGTPTSKSVIISIESTDQVAGDFKFDYLEQFNHQK